VSLLCNMVVRLKRSRERWFRRGEQKRADAKTEKKLFHG